MDEKGVIPPNQEIDFCTLGMFIIGENALIYCLLSAEFKASLSVNTTFSKWSEHHIVIF